ncbi:IS4 family transposase [Streptomyces albidoflavus]
MVGDAGRSEKRRRLLSARFTVYFVLAMCLFPQVDYLEVLRLVKTGDPGLRPWAGVNKSSLTRTRQRLGWTVMRELIWAVARPLGREDDLFHGLRVLALDGMLLSVPDSAANNDAFGKSGSQRSPMGYPQARVVAVAECSSHAVLDAAIGGFKESERIVSDSLDAHVGRGTLLLADRGLWGLARWHRLRDQGTHLLWRIERPKARRVQDMLPDGSYLAWIEANKHSKAAGKVKAPPAAVRVIEYRIDGQPDIVRLITSLTDHEKYPAVELAALYARRWEIELVFDEIETHQRGRRPAVANPGRGAAGDLRAPDRAACHPRSAGRSRPTAPQYGRADVVHPGPARCPPHGDRTERLLPPPPADVTGAWDSPRSATACYPVAGSAIAPARSARASPATATRPPENQPATTVPRSSSA